MCKLLSIIIPVLNEAQTLHERRDYFRTLAEHAELIFVDGGSTDSTSVCCENMGFVTHKSAITFSRGAQIATGIRYASYDHICIHHVDSLMDTKAIKALQLALQTHVWGRFDVRIDDTHWCFRVIERSMNWRSRLTSIATGDQCMFARRDYLLSILTDLGNNPLMEDIYISRQLRKHGRPTCLSVSVITSARYWQRHGIMRTILKMWWFRAQFYFGRSANELYKKYYS